MYLIVYIYPCQEINYFFDAYNILLWETDFLEMMNMLTEFGIELCPEVVVICSTKDTFMLGADFYETDAERASLLAEGQVPIGVGKNTKIR